MGNLVHLHGDVHEQTLKLLPWYLNGTLDDAEAAMVEAHLAECEACDRKAEDERSLRDGVTRLGIDADHGWAAMRHRLQAAEATPARGPAAWRRRIGVGWAAAGALAASLATVALTSLHPSAPDTLYRALGSAPVTAKANVIILFAPDLPTADMRRTLTSAQARVIDGPLASGGFLVHVAPGERTRRIEQLRAGRGVVLAEPLDAPQRP